MDKFTKFSLWAISIMFIVGIAIQFVSGAMPEYQTISYPVDYHTEIDAGIVHSQFYSLMGAKVSEFTFLEVELYGDWKSSDVLSSVNNISCSPNSWTTPSSDGYRVRFDCTNAVVQSGETKNINLSFYSTGKSDNVYGTITMNYLTEGEPDLNVYGTDYFPNDDATIFLQLLDGERQSINNSDSSCFAKAFLPNKTKLFENAPMSYLEDGLFYYDLTIPSTTGLYIVSAECLSPSYTWIDTFADYSYVDEYVNVTIDGGKFSLDDASYSSSINFSKCMNITIANAGSTTLSDYPAYINLTKDSDMLSDYSDIRFYDSYCGEDANLLAHEIEAYDSNHADVWVRIPSLPATGTTLSVYYENNTAISSSENATGVWDSNYMMVHHLEESDIDGGSGDIKDSTSYGNNGTTFNMDTSDQIVGRVDGSFDFDGTSERLDVAHDTSIDFADESFSYSFWVNGDENSFADDDRFFVKGTTSGGCGGGNAYEVYYKSGLIEFRIDDDSTKTEPTRDASNYLDNTWHYVTYTRNTTTNEIKIYLDGSQDGSTETDLTGDISNGCDLEIGGSANTGSYSPITFDEVRISDTVRTADWINQSYQMIANQDTLVTFGSEIPTPPDINVTFGYVKSIPINLTRYNWNEFSAIYNLFSGALNFSVLDSSETLLCSGLGNISDCAGTENQIILYVEFTRTGQATSPELDSWAVQMNNGSIEELRGAGELNVREWGGNTTVLAESIWSYDGTVSSNILSQFSTNIWNFYDRTLTGFGTLISNIWSYGTRELTAVNTTQIADEVWNDSVDRGKYTHGIILS